MDVTKEENRSQSYAERRGMPPRAWAIQVTALALFLGLLLGAALRAQQNSRREGTPSARYGVPRTMFQELKKQNDALSEQIKTLNEAKTQLTSLVAQGAPESEAIQKLTQQIQSAKAWACLTPLSGPGVIITLQDSPLKPNPSWGYDPQDYTIHDLDVFLVVNELKAAGAEALAINAQRLIASSSIRCEGPTVRVNYTHVGMPLEIKAIGDPEVLASGLRMRGGVLDPEGQRVFLKMAALEKADNLVVPAFAGPTTFKYARTVQR